ncbi:MAG: DEAD/DEAH box helicase, partial [Microthrixaceae bacterium]
QILGSIRDLDPEWPVVVFAGSVLHAQQLAVALNDEGISARPVWGELSQWARRHAIEEFRSNRVRVLTNYNVLSEGFDAPRTRAVVIARLVQSDGLFLQMLGRGMRGPRNGGTSECMLVTTGERLPDRFDPEGNLDVERHEHLWSAK